MHMRGLRLCGAAERSCSTGHPKRKSGGKAGRGMEAAPAGGDQAHIAAQARPDLAEDERVRQRGRLRGPAPRASARTLLFEQQR